MSDHRYHSGCAVTWYNGTGTAVAAGEWVRVANVNGLGLATTAIGVAGVGEVMVEEAVYKVTKAASQAWTAGAKIYYNATADNFTTVALGNYFAGYATAQNATTATVAASAATVGYIKLARFHDEGGRTVTMAATGAQSLSAINCLGGGTVCVEVPNTAALTLTLPAAADCPDGTLINVRKTAAAAFAITVAAASGDTLVGSTGTIDADNDRALILMSGGEPIVIANTIA